MVSPRQGQHRLALISLLLLVHCAVAAHLKAEETFDVLTAIQTQVDAMNTNLQDLSDAIKDSPEPTSAPPTDEPATSTSGTTTTDSTDTKRRNLKRLLISRNFLTLEADPTSDPACDKLPEIETTLENAQEALDLVSEKQLSNTTLEKLQYSNGNLTATTQCVKEKKIIPDDKDAIQSVITETQTKGEKASDTIDNIVSPTTPTPPEDYSGFKSATIALGVLFSLALIAVAGLAIYIQRQK